MYLWLLLCSSALFYIALTSANSCSSHFDCKASNSSVISLCINETCTNCSKEQFEYNGIQCVEPKVNCFRRSECEATLGPNSKCTNGSCHCYAGYIANITLRSNYTPCLRKMRVRYCIFHNMCMKSRSFKTCPAPQCGCSDLFVIEGTKCVRNKGVCFSRFDCPGGYSSNRWRCISQKCVKKKEKKNHQANSGQCRTKYDCPYERTCSYGECQEEDYSGQNKNKSGYIYLYVILPVVFLIIGFMCCLKWASGTNTSHTTIVEVNQTDNNVTFCGQINPNRNIVETSFNVDTPVSVPNRSCRISAPPYESVISEDLPPPYSSVVK